MNRGARASAPIALALALAVAACAPAVPGGNAVSLTGAGHGGQAASPVTAAGSPIPLESFEPVAARSPLPSPTARPARPAPAPALNARIKRALQAALDEARAAAGIPGISASVRFPDGSTWTGASGYADVATKDPVTATTAFAIGSISKTFLAALTVELADEGVFGLEDSVASYLPEIKLNPAITVRMLLDHTSGLGDYFLNPKIDRALQSQPSRSWDARRALGYVGKPYFPPGRGWRYSNTNYLLLGLLVERVAQRPVADLLRERFLDPLGLEGTWYQGAEKARTALAHGYRLSGAVKKPRITDLSDGSGIAPFRSVVTAAGGAGAVAATAGDVARWAEALFGGEAMDARSVALMIAGVDRVAAYRPRVPYGLGVQAIAIDERPTFGHSGRLLGFRAAMRWLPSDRVAIAVLTNQSRADVGPIVARLLAIALPPPGPCRCPRPI